MRAMRENAACLIKNLDTGVAVPLVQWSPPSPHELMLRTSPSSTDSSTLEELAFESPASNTQVGDEGVADAQGGAAEHKSDPDADSSSPDAHTPGSVWLRRRLRRSVTLEQLAAERRAAQALVISMRAAKARSPNSKVPQPEREAANHQELN